MKRNYSDKGDEMKLATTWDDGKYIWEYFTDWFEAYQASRIGTLVVESSPHNVWRSRAGYSQSVFQTIKAEAMPLWKAQTQR